MSRILPALLLLLLAFSWKPVTRAAAPATEAEIKAVLLFHLTQFVTWPTSVVNNATFDIGILGADSFGPALETALAGEKVNGKPIRVVRSNRARDLTGCPLVYVAQTREPLARVFQQLRELPSLTVGESEEFFEAGGMIRFRRTAEKKVRLQVHLPRVRASEFKISAQLLRVADVVEEEAR